MVRGIANTVSGKQLFLNTCCLTRYSATDVIDEVRLVSEDIRAFSINLSGSLLGAYPRLSSGSVSKITFSADTWCIISTDASSETLTSHEST